MNYLQALQYGVIGLVAIMLIRASMLLAKELGRASVRPEATRLITMFLVFCVVLACISGVVQFLDNKNKQAIANSLAQQKIERAHRIGDEAKTHLHSKELLEAKAILDRRIQQTYDNIIDRLKSLADELSHL